MNPKRGEIWLINLDPTVGAEIKKTRPAVVISSDSIGKLPLKIVVPITAWNDSFQNSLWHVRINPDKGNGLGKISVVDSFQIRCISTTRFSKQLGAVTGSQLEEIVQAVGVVLELG